MAELPSSDKPTDQPVTDQPKPESETPPATIEPTGQDTNPDQTVGPATDVPPATNASVQETPQVQEAANTIVPAKPTSKRILFIIGGLLVIGFSALFAYFLSVGTQATPTQTNITTNDVIQPTLAKENDNTSTDINNPQAFSKLFVYGSWSGQTSLIKAVELSNNTTTLLASLPSSIKKVSVLSAQNLIYIDQTDKRDHGRQIIIYDMKKKGPQGSIPAAPGFGIDDYVLSPDKKYLAIWEVAFAPNSEILQGGKSRVYAVDLSRPTVKKLLYDEVAGPASPVHYPRAILDNGRVFADKFLPNDPKGGAGWAYGLSVVDFDGTNRQDLPQMMGGTYGTQPSLSPDGKWLVFSGYDGEKGDGNAISGGYRQAILSPNTVELLDTESLIRQKLPNLDNKNIYSSSEWDSASGKIILTVISGDSSNTGVYSYALNERQLVQLIIPSTETAKYGFLTQVTNNTTIIGTQDSNGSNLGNLGEGYAFPFTQVALLDRASKKVSFVRLEDTFAQYITTLPGNYFTSVLGVQTAEAQTIPKPDFVDLYSSKNEEKPGQQLYTFMVKNDLLTVRQSQQSSPLKTPLLQVSGTPNSEEKPIKCEDLAVQQCAEQGVTQAADKDTYDDCVDTNKDKNKTQKSSGLCSDSPLYLYGPNGMQIDVTIQTAISNAIPAYNNGYDVTLKDNKMEINGQLYRSIAYDYQPNMRKIIAPRKGTVVAKENIGAVLRQYAAKFGLNAKETADLVAAGKQKTISQYVFVSFFDQKTSEQMLPISFNPKPDNYLNIVFYFKNLDDKPAYSPLPPVFPEPVQRNGFTAVEISEFVE